MKKKSVTFGPFKYFDPSSKQSLLISLSNTVAEVGVQVNCDTEMA